MFTMDAKKALAFVKKLQQPRLEVKELQAKYLHSFRLHDSAPSVTDYEVCQAA